MSRTQQQGRSDLTLDDLDVVLPGGHRYCGADLGNFLTNGGPALVAARLTDLADRVTPAVRQALLELASQVAPGPTPHRFAAQCSLKPHGLPRCDQPDRLVGVTTFLAAESPGGTQRQRRRGAARRPLLRLVHREAH
jgi:hypothetical protein